MKLQDVFIVRPNQPNQRLLVHHSNDKNYFCLICKKNFSLFKFQTLILIDFQTFNYPILL